MITPMDIQNRLIEIRNLQIEEANNGFPNGDLWNILDDICFNLITYGQESNPTDIVEDGVLVGYRLDNGTEVFYEGMTFENQY
jgi:hypothetical protein